MMKGNWLSALACFLALVVSFVKRSKTFADILTVAGGRLDAISSFIVRLNVTLID